MFRCGPAILFFWTMLISAAPAEAQWMTNFWDGVHRQYRRNSDWPEPFLRPDRESVTLPFGLMVANGWRRQNLLSDYHFQDDNLQLNQGGELKLRFILTQMPPQRRTVFVQRGPSPDVTATRIEIVQRAAGRMLPPDAFPEIVESDLPNDGWPAEEVDSVTKRFNSSRPQPRVISSSGGGSNSGSGGGSSSGGSR
ncbi:MAG: hypothetical protein HY288_05410 [Planctomycetia bacterium]|nr:hypothetical protein [Planctomycetia bacterium]